MCFCCSLACIKTAVRAIGIELRRRFGIELRRRFKHYSFSYFLKAWKQRKKNISIKIG